jgi:citrate lyase beta subunit
MGPLGRHKISDLYIRHCALHRAAPELLEALEIIAEGKGAFNHDPLLHAQNVIEEAKTIAQAAIAKAKP